MRQQKKTACIRIIGGKWRSRRLPVLADTSIRPTSDRIRETLFNWLQGHITGANCLDLFAGSGALGFEALSRGAHNVTMIEEDVRVIQQLQLNALTLETEQAEIVWQQAQNFLGSRFIATNKQPYDIVFLDPPFRDNLLEQCCSMLEQGAWLTETALIYLESDKGRAFPEPLPGWQIIHDKHAGQVAYRLLRRTPGSH